MSPPTNPDPVIPLFPNLINLQLGALRTELIRIGGLTVQRRMCKLWAVNGYVHDLDFSDGFMLVYKLQLYFAQFKYIQFIVCHMYLNMGKNIWLQNLVLLDEINWEGGKVVSRL